MKWSLWLFLTFLAYADPPNLSLPFSCGESMLNNMGYGGQGYSGTKNTHINNDYYAVDFTKNGCDPWGRPILAAAAGIIKEAVSVPINGYGQYVLIDHGDGYQTKYCHLNNVYVNVGQCVSKGFIIGTLGNSGFSITSAACPEHPGAHLHFVYYRIVNGIKTGLKPEPLSNFVDLTYGQWYQSDNCPNSYSTIGVGEFLEGGAWHWSGNDCGFFEAYSEPFATDYFFNNFQKSTIYPISHVHKNYIVFRDFWIQNFEGVGIGFVTMIYNPYRDNKRTGCKGVVYHVQGRMRSYWLMNGYSLGPPVTNEYYLDCNGHRYTVQWFEKAQSEFTAVCYDRDLGGDCFLGSNTGLLSYGDLLAKIDEHNLINSGCENGDCGQGGDLPVDDFPYPNDTSFIIPSVVFPFQSGFQPVDYDVFKFNGLVFGLSCQADGNCWDVLDTGSVFAPSGPNIWCVMELADVSGTFQCNMVFYRSGAYWWETGYGQTSNTGGDTWPCVAMPIEADCFKESGQYQVEVKVKHNGKEYSLAKRDLLVSSDDAVQTIPSPLKTKTNFNQTPKFFDLKGRLIVGHKTKMSGVFLFKVDKKFCRKVVLNDK